MSADNYYEINAQRQKDGSFRFGVNMGFASDDRESPLYNTGRTQWFSSLDEAVEFTSEQYAEYGWSMVDNEDWHAYNAEKEAAAKEAVRLREQDLLARGAAQERARIVRLLTVLAELRATYGTKADLESDNHMLRQMALSMSVSIDTMRQAAVIIDSGLLEEAYGYLPSWHWGDPRLRELGLGA